MTKKIRFTLFLILLILFFLTAPLIIFYSLGWRFDLKTKRIVQPGAFYFKIWPKSAEVFLNGKLKEKSDFFFGSVFIENLPPQKYKVKIEKQGFQPWSKKLEIKKREVTEAKNIILIPKNPSLKVISEGTEKLFFFPKRKKIILKENLNLSQNFNSGSSWLAGQKTKKSWTLKLFDLNKEIKSRLIEESNILTSREIIKKEEKASLSDLILSPDSKKVLLKVKKNSERDFYLLEIDKNPPPLMFLDFLNPGAEKIDFNPENSQKLIIFGKKSLSEGDLAEREESKPILKNILGYAISGNFLYFLDESGFLFKSDFSFAYQKKLNIVPFHPKKEAQYKIAVSSSDIALKENQTLYLLDKEKKTFKKISESVNDFKFSPDFKKLLYYNDNEIWIVFLEKKYSQPPKEAGERLFLTRFSKKIDKIFWFDNDYLIFNVGEEIKIVETDERDKINIVDFTKLKNPEIFWDKFKKKLYILSEGNLYLSEKLAP